MMRIGDIVFIPCVICSFMLGLIYGLTLGTVLAALALGIFPAMVEKFSQK